MSTAKRSAPWQLVIAWLVGCISVVNMLIVNLFPLEVVRSSLWIYTFPVIYLCVCAVLCDAVKRVQSLRQKVSWSCWCLASFFMFCKFVFNLYLIPSDITTVGVFASAVLGLIIYFPRNAWSLGKTVRVIFDVFVLSFSIISLLQSGIYASFERNRQSTSAASYSIWLGFEIVGLMNTIFVWQRYQHSLLKLPILAALCFVLGDISSTARRWYPGIYATSGLPDISMGYLAWMIICIFSYYSIDHFRDAPPSELITVVWSEWFYRAGIPRIALIISMALSFFLCSPDRYVVVVLLIFAFIQVIVSVDEEFHLAQRFNEARASAAQLNEILADRNRHLATANQELQRRQQAEADLAAERARTAMARDIHDSLGGHLHAASTISSSLMDLEGLPPRLLQMLNRLHGSVSLAHQEMRRAITVLNTAEQTDAPALPLDEALVAPVADAQQYGLPVTLSVQGTPRPVPAATASELVRVTQEALTNTRKYAQASEVRVTVDYTDPSGLVLVIADNGVGMPTPSTGPRADGTGNGLGNMRARVEALGGQFALPPVEQGVTLWMKLPK